ncbi:MAG: hypothetical protein H7315_18025 [Herminiimonas sp.]|nr:hypothetical protein [Herminiimonas sp.]
MIDSVAAIGIARKRAEEKGWAFAEPFAVTTRRAWFSCGLLRFETETNAGMRGTKARFVIDARSGEIISEGYLPR